MKSRLVVLLLLLGITCIVLVFGNRNSTDLGNNVAFGQVAEESRILQEEISDGYPRDRARIRELAANRDYEGLKGFSEELRSKWRKQPGIRSRLLAEISHAFSSYDFQNRDQYGQSVRLAKEILAIKEGVPISTRYEMVRKLQTRSSYILGAEKKESWERDRSERMKYVFDFWQFIEANIDRSFDLDDPANQPVGNVEVPGRYFPGTSPEAIKEPNIRKEYERRLAVNNLKAERFNLQFELHKIDATLPELVERIMIEFYSIDPIRPVEVKNYIQLFRLSSESKGRITEAINRRRVVK